MAEERAPRWARAIRLTKRALLARPAISTSAKTDASAVAGGGLGGGHIEVAFPEMERNFLERALSPLFRLRLPEDPAFVSRLLFSALSDRPAV